MAKNIFFSVIIPTYNRSLLINKTVTSVLNQTYDHFEIIIVDDGSIDDTEEVVKNIEDPRIKYFWKENKERGAARNYGFHRAIGDYVLFLDSDDIMASTHLSTLDKYIDVYPETNFFATKFQVERSGERKVFDDLNAATEGFYDYSWLLTGNHLACNICVRKANESLIYFLEDRSYAIMEDWMFLVLNLRLDQLYLIDQVSITMNDHSQRSMRESNLAVIEKRLLATNWLIENISLSKSETQLMKGSSHQFCVIHALSDRDYVLARAHLKMAIKMLGLNRLNMKLIIRTISHL